MAAPVGHALMGMAVARRLGVRSRRGLAAAALLGTLPDLDIPLGLLLHRDPWKYHRRATHTLAFAVAAGALAGAAGAASRGDAAGGRDIVADAAVGAAVVGSHVLLDRLPYVPETRVGPMVFDLSLLNWVIDSIQWALAARLVWPGPEAAAAPASP